MKRDEFDIAKEKAIVSVLEYLESKSEEHERYAVSNLLILSELYHLTRALKKTHTKTSVISALKALCDSRNPLSATVNELINAIECNNI